MSLHRVSSIETFTTIPTSLRPRRDSDASTRARRLTFNPLPEGWDPPTTVDHPQTVAASVVPKWKRLLQVAASVTCCFLAAGIVFGYAAIKPVLKAEGAYRHVCSTPGGLEPEDEGICVEMHLNMMFTVAAVATNVAALPVGAILDHYGPRVCGLLASLFLSAGAVLMAFESRVPFDGMLLGYLLLALGGPFTYISSFQLSNAFPSHSGFILALMTGAFDASSAVFLIYRLIYNATEGAFSHQRFFLAYLLIPAAIVVLQLTLMPGRSYKTVGELVEEMESERQQQRQPPIVPDPAPYDQVDEETALLQEEERQYHTEMAEGIRDVLGGPTKAVQQTRREERKNMKSGVWGVMHPYSAWEQLRSPWFVLICLFTIIQMTRINFFVATIRPQYTSLLGSPAAAARLNTFFDVALPAGGILAIPFIGLILDRTPTVAVLASLVLCGSTIGVLGIIRNSMWAGYANVCLFVLFRPFYYTAVSDFCAKVFGFETFGTVYGAIICVSGVLNLGQGGLDWLFQRQFGGDPVPVNVGLLVVALGVGVVLVGYVGWKARGVRRGLLEEEARVGGGGGGGGGGGETNGARWE